MYTFREGWADSFCKPHGGAFLGEAMGQIPSEDQNDKRLAGDGGQRNGFATKK